MPADGVEPSTKTEIYSSHCKLNHRHMYTLESIKYVHSLFCFIIPRSWKGGMLVSRHPFVCPSICLWTKSWPLCIFHNTYLPDPFHICTSYQGTSESVCSVKFIVKFNNLNFWQIFGICNFDFVLLWHGIRYESIVWVIMGRWGVFSEHRRSSCFNFSCGYCQTSSVSCTKSQNLNVSCLVLQLPFPNPLKLGIKLRMKM